MPIQIEKIFLKTIVSFFIIFGIYLCFIGGYGSDEDTLPMIGVFLGILEGGNFMTSRFTGYPVAEMGIGFLAVFFGSFVTNLVTFLNLIIGLTFFYLSFEKKIDTEKFSLFLLLCLSSSVLFFDNLEPMDYSWALIFFSSGLYFTSKKYYELAVILFGLCIGTRINFTLFVIGALIFFPIEDEKLLIRKFLIILGSIFIGGLFYIPVWYQSYFGLDWLTAARPLEQGYAGLLFRFLYKSIHSFSVLPFIFILLLFISGKFKFNKNRNNITLISLIILNLLLFFYIPAELSYIQIVLICVYYLFIKSLNKKIIYLIVLLNLTTWAVNFDFVEIQRVSNDRCAPVQALNAKFNFKILNGSLEKFYNTRSLIECWVTDKNSEFGRKIILGEPLKK